jgi:hypothetical protein
LCGLQLVGQRYLTGGNFFGLSFLDDGIPVDLELEHHQTNGDSRGTAEYSNQTSDLRPVNELRGGAKMGCLGISLRDTRSNVIKCVFGSGDILSDAYLEARSSLCYLSFCPQAKRNFSSATVNRTSLRLSKASCGFMRKALDLRPNYQLTIQLTQAAKSNNAETSQTLPHGVCIQKVGMSLRLMNPQKLNSAA